MEYANRWTETQAEDSAPQGALTAQMVFSYVVRWDHGFAPNPFHGVCTLATCKPDIRKKASDGDWILGTGSAERGYEGRAIFLMRISERLRFDEYWADPRYDRKRPVMNGSLKQRFGDNIYHRDQGEWVQADSRHSYDGQANVANLKRDTAKTDRVLIASDFTYWGDSAPRIPAELKAFVISRPGWKEDFTEAQLANFHGWASDLDKQGQVGDPVEWRYERWWR